MRFPGRAGDGMVHRVAFRVGSEASLDFWQERVGGERTDGSLVFDDPEGLELELVVDDGVDAPLVARHPEIPEEHALRGFAGVRAYASSPARSADFLAGLTFDGSGAEWESRGDRHGFYVYDEPPDDRRGIPGAGTVHHVAWSVPLDEHAGWVEKAAAAGARPTPVIDRFWFRSIYFREPSGILFEIASLGPGFTTDEDLEHLGEKLILPPAFEHLRAQVEPQLTPLPSPAPVIVRERPASGEPEGALVLFHGRGADEHDLFPLLDVLDPERRLDGYTPRGPLSLPPGGAHWYIVPRVGYPDPDTFNASYREASDWLDSLPHERLVLGGFSQGCVMSLALGLGTGRPRPVAIAGFSGFIPVVEGWQPDLERPMPPVALGHGTYDPVIDVSFGRTARDTLLAAGGEVLYKEYPLPHTLDQQFLVEVREWLQAKL